MAPETFGFWPIDKPIQAGLLKACRAMLQRATPPQIRDLAYLTYALQRLPLTTPEVSGGVVLASRQSDSAAYRGFDLEPDLFTLTSGESIDSGCGMDHESRTILEVGTDAMRDLEDGYDFTEWLNLFYEQAQDPETDIEVFCDAGSDIDLHADTGRLHWEDNPLLPEE